MAEPFIKLYKKMLKWEWYDDPNTKILFIHCLLRANWQEVDWHGFTLKPGQFITSIASLSKETKLSARQVRVALDHLIMTGEVTNKSFNKFRIITVVKWGEYQAHDKQNDNQMTDKRQSNDNQMTTDKEYKEIKNKKNIYSASAPKTAAEKSGGNTRKYSHEFFEELERQAALNPWGVVEVDDEEGD